MFCPPTPSRSNARAAASWGCEGITVPDRSQSDLRYRDCGSTLQVAGGASDSMGLASTSPLASVPKVRFRSACQRAQYLTHTLLAVGSCGHLCVPRSSTLLTATYSCPNLLSMVTLGLGTLPLGTRSVRGVLSPAAALNLLFGSALRQLSIPRVAALDACFVP